MNSKHLVAVILLTVILGYRGTGVVSAGLLDGVRGELKAEKQEALLEKKSFMNDFKSALQSSQGKIKDFLGFGKAAIGSGELTAKSDTSLVVTKDGKTFTVYFDEKTKFRRRFWGKSSLDEFTVGDTVNVIGKWTDETHTAVQAVLLRDLSIQMRFGVFFGQVKSFVSSGWVMSAQGAKRPDQTVTVSSETKFTNRNGDAILKSDVQVGHRVRVRGLWDNKLNTVTDVKEVKDFSLPTLPAGEVSVTVTAKATATPSPAPTSSPSPTPTPAP